MTELVTSCFDDWKTTLWIEIDVESMEVECKKFVKEIRGMDKEMRAWDVYRRVVVSIIIRTHSREVGGQ